MIITRTPLRISIGGGGTDLPSYSERFDGFVISGAINKYIYVSINRTFHPGFLLKYSRMERVEDVERIEHRLIREALKGCRTPSGIEIVSIADVPAGTGLGSSGSFAVGLLHALHAFNRSHTSAGALAEEAFDIEYRLLGEPVGRQDQMIAAYGGLLCQEYHADGRIEAYPLPVSDATIRDLDDHLMLFFTGYSRTSHETLTDQKSRSNQGDKAMLENLHFTKQLGGAIGTALKAGDCVEFARLMHEHWLYKKERSQGISNQTINEVYDHGRANGAIGGKLVGAGGGGFLLFYTHDRPGLRRAMAERGLQELPFAFDFDGSTVLLRN